MTFILNNIFVSFDLIFNTTALLEESKTGCRLQTLVPEQLRKRVHTTRYPDSGVGQTQVGYQEYHQLHAPITLVSVEIDNWICSVPVATT